MKGKIIAIAAAGSLVLSSAASAEEISVYRSGNDRAIVMSFDSGGRLSKSSMSRSGDGQFSLNIPDEYAKNKVYFVGTGELTDAEALRRETAAQETPAPLETPEGTKAPAASQEPSSAAATKAPAASQEPSSAAATKAPSASKAERNSTPYEKQADGLNAPAVVTDVAYSENAKGDDVIAVTVLYHGENVTVGINPDLKIAWASEEYSYMAGQTAESLEEGDVITMTANIAGDKIKTINFITRPPAEDIVTGSTDYGTNFEKLFSVNGKVANAWTVRKYGEKQSRDKYQYAFGIVGRMSNGTLSLLNLSSDPDDIMDIDVDPLAYIYECDVSGKEYTTGTTDKSGIQASVSSKTLNSDVIELDPDRVYNYALVRLVDDTATDIVLFNNYND